MTIEEFAKHLESKVQPHGKEAWKIASEWAAANGRSRKLSLYDLHELSKMISDALDNAHEPAPQPEGRSCETCANFHDKYSTEACLYEANNDCGEGDLSRWTPAAPSGEGEG